ncbi:MAG TPA: helix-turn-helix domain-containing protein, partial [Flavobacterium sp.]|nr:helix-turn-helix domain-containing protein [Flavobacterium sp.]
RLAEKEAQVHHDVHYYAGILCMTQGNLTKIVKEVTGKPPKALLEEILTRMAKELLDNSLLPVYLVAEELNFKSSSAFINFFRTQTGSTPNEYRNRNTR